MAPPFIADVYFGDSQARAASVSRVQILEGEYEHERALVTVDEGDPTSKRFATGAPVSILWGTPPARSAWFIGYVNHTEPAHQPTGVAARSGDRPMLVVCVGTSWPTKNQGTRTLRNVPPANAVRTVAEEFRFDLTHAERGGTPWPSLHQHGMSDWEFMVDCAKKAGKTLFTRGATLHCRDRRALIEAYASTSPVLASSTAGGDVREFVPARGANTPSGGDLAVRGAFSINPRSGAALVTTQKDTGRPLFNARPVAPVQTKVQTTMTFASLGEAKERLAAEAAVNSLSITAKLVGAANPRCRVGRTVAVTGFGEDGDGLWYVTAADQVIEPGGKTSMTLALGRDTEMPATGVRTPPPSSAPPARGARVLSGRWVAA